VYKVGMCDHKKSKRGVFAATVVVNEKLCEEHFSITLSVHPDNNGGKKFPPSDAGHFVQIQCKSPKSQDTAHLVEVSAGNPPKFSLGELTNKQPLLRRPLSLGGRREVDGNITELEIIYRVVGTGTQWMSALKPGAEISVLGPLGNSFVIRTDKPTAALVGGGVGIPPMLYTAQMLSKYGECGGKNIETVAFCGSQTKDLFPLTIEEIGRAHV